MSSIRKKWGKFREAKRSRRTTPSSVADKLDASRIATPASPDLDEEAFADSHTEQLPDHEIPGEFTDPENEMPLGSDPFQVLKDKTKPDAVRRALALPIMWFLLGIYAVTIGTFVITRLIPTENSIFSAHEFTASIAAISGLQGLGAAVVGFYFGAKQSEK